MLTRAGQNTPAEALQSDTKLKDLQVFFVGSIALTSLSVMFAIFRAA